MKSYDDSRSGGVEMKVKKVESMKKYNHKQKIS